MDSMKEEKGNLDSQLWHACAGGMVQIPSIDSKVFYFPQGHAEQARGDLNFGSPKISPLILCTVSAVRFMADSETDEVFAEITLIPLRSNDFDREEDDWTGGSNQSESEEKHTSFAKTLTQSDANNGGGFSVPRYCAETIFPPLDYSANPPVQTIHAKDVHGQIWKFRHIYRGTPRRHLLTTGWSNFVNCKKLVAGDSVVFLKSENGELQIGIRRAKRGVGGRFDFSIPQLATYSNGDPRGKVTAESIIKAVNLASSGQAFSVKYFPRSNTPEFFVKASTVRAAMQVRLSTGMRFKMAFETEDSSRISWFMGTISSTQPADPIRWPNSPWRLLQVTWDEPDLLQNVKFVNPWSVEVVTNTTPYHVSPFAPQRKKPRLQSNSHFSRMLDDDRAGIQGARHVKSLNPPLKEPNVENPTNILKENEMKTPHILLFGQVILPGQRVSKGNSKDTTGNSSSEKTDASYGAATSPHWNSSPENLSDAGFVWCKDHQKTVLDSGDREELVDQLFFTRHYFPIP